MKIIAIETSCDETAIAIIEARGNKAPLFRIGSNIVSSQVAVHKPWGGVVPNLAKREHQRNLVPALERALKESKLLRIQNPKSKILNYNSKLKNIKKILKREEVLYEKLNVFLAKCERPNIDAIAVTIGPGLEPALWVGVNFARALAYWWDFPIIPVNHVEAHIFANWLGPISSKSKIKIQNTKLQFKIKNLFPALCLVVSGGHTQLILMKDFGKYKLIGETRDDAAGECFDKAAKILGLGYPGGPAIAAWAAMADAAEPKTQNLSPRDISRRETKLKTTNQNSRIYDVKLPRPMMHTNDYDFSFSGLKTAVLYKVRELKTINYQLKTELCAEIQQAVIDVLIHKTLRAAQEYKVKIIMLGGGVVANEELRRQFTENIAKQLPHILHLIPNISFCTDNAAMVGAAACFHRDKKTPWQKIKAKANLRIKYPSL